MDLLTDEQIADLELQKAELRKQMDDIDSQIRADRNQKDINRLTTQKADVVAKASAKLEATQKATIQG